MMPPMESPIVNLARTNLSVEKGKSRAHSGANFEAEYQLEDPITHEWIGSVDVQCVIPPEIAGGSLNEIEAWSLTRVKQFVELTAASLPVANSESPEK